MNSAKIRVVVAGLCFAAWLGWLGYLAATKASPLVVSPAQMMASTHFVLVEVAIEQETGKPKTTQTVKEELKAKASRIQGEIAIYNLKEARIAGQREAVFHPGTLYLLPLTKMSEDNYELTPPPKSPGNEQLNRGRPWAYPWNDSVKKQFEQLTQ